MSDETLDADEDATQLRGSVARGPGKTPGPGDTIGRYVVQRTLGAGAMGVVLAALDPELEREVAIKLVKGDHVDAKRRARMMREARAMAKLSHTNVAAIYDVGEVDGSVFIAMELLDGRTLGEWQGERARESQEVLDVFAQAGRGLAAAHELGLVHRDFKPDNVIVDQRGRVCVVDFGLARSADDEHEGERPEAGTERGERGPGAREGGRTLDANPSGTGADSNASGGLERLTRTGALVGTPAYMSPEQFLGEPTGPASDQFSFCVALHEALAGSRPFRGSSMATLALAVTTDDPPSLPATVGTARMRAAIVRGLARRPEDRFASMGDLLAALAPEPRSVRGRTGWVVAAGLGLGIVAAAAWWVGTGGAANPTPAPDPCHDAAAPIREIWNESEKQRLHAAMTASGVAYADPTMERVSDRLDRWTDAWSSSADASCRATREARSQSEGLFVQREACLEQRRAALAARLESWRTMDAADVEGAVAAIGALPHVRECDDVETLGRAEALPTSEAAREEIRRIEARLARARALEWEGAIPEALALIEQVVVDAEAAGYGPLTARALLRLAQLQQTSAQHDDAITSLERATEIAADAGADSVAAKAWILLAHFVGSERKEFDKAVGYVAAARAAARRAGSDPRAMTDIASLEGSVAFFQGKYEDAKRHWEEAARLGDAAPDAELLGARARNNLAAVAQSVGDTDSAIAQYGQALEIFERSLGPTHPTTAQVRANLGQAFADAGRYGEAAVQHRAALAAFESVHGGDHPHVAQTLGSLGVDLRRLGRTDEARAVLERALASFEARSGPEHADLVGPLLNLGSVHLESGDAKTAISMHERALAISERAYGADHMYVAHALHSLGDDRLKTEEYEMALEHFDRALRIFEASGAQGDPRARVTFGAALALDALGRDSKRRRALAAAALPVLERAYDADEVVPRVRALMD